MKELPEAERLEVNGKSNAVDYLKRSISFIKEAEEDPFAWKWVTIALHGALYAFAIENLQDTYSQRVLDGERLIGFWEALDRCKESDWMIGLAGSRPLQMTSDQEKALKALVSHFRNEFVHFKPKGWSIDLFLMPEMTIHALEVIRFLALETRTMIFPRLGVEGQAEVEQLVTEGIGAVRSSELYSSLQELKQKVSKAG